MAKDRSENTLVLASEKELNIAANVQKKMITVKEVTVNVIKVMPADKRILARTSLGMLIIRDGKDFPKDWNITKKQVMDEIKKQVTSGRLRNQ